MATGFIIFLHLAVFSFPPVIYNLATTDQFRNTGLHGGHTENIDGVLMYS